MGSEDSLCWKQGAERANQVRLPRVKGSGPGDMGSRSSGLEEQDRKELLVTKAKARDCQGWKQEGRGQTHRTLLERKSSFECPVFASCLFPCIWLDSCLVPKT